MKDGGLSVAISLGLGSILFLALIITGAFDMPIDSGGWIYEYQTLISALVAIATAWIIWHQHKDILRRKGNRMRASFPDALANLSKYIDDCFLYINNGLDIGLPYKPDKDILVFKEAIEFLEKNNSDSIFDMISFYQVFNSRLSTYKLDGNPQKKEYIIRDIAKMSYLILVIWSFARGETEIIPHNKILTKENYLEGLKASMMHSLISFEKRQNYINITEKQKI